MKKIIIGLMLFTGISATSNLTNAQVVVVKPTKTVVVKNTNYRRGYVWVSGNWVWNSRKNIYIWKEGRWVKRRKHQRYVSGSWVVVRGAGYRWVPGRWVRT